MRREARMARNRDVTVEALADAVEGGDDMAFEMLAPAVFPAIGVTDGAFPKVVRKLARTMAAGGADRVGAFFDRMSGTRRSPAKRGAGELASAVVREAWRSVPQGEAGRVLAWFAERFGRGAAGSLVLPARPGDGAWLAGEVAGTAPAAVPALFVSAAAGWLSGSWPEGARVAGACVSKMPPDWRVWALCKAVAMSSRPAGDGFARAWREPAEDARRVLYGELEKNGCDFSCAVSGRTRNIVRMVSDECGGVRFDDGSRYGRSAADAAVAAMEPVALGMAAHREGRGAFAMARGADMVLSAVSWGVWRRATLEGLDERARAAAGIMERVGLSGEKDLGMALLDAFLSSAWGNGSRSGMGGCGEAIAGVFDLSGRSALELAVFARPRLRGTLSSGTAGGTPTVRDIVHDLTGLSERDLELWVGAVASLAGGPSVDDAFVGKFVGEVSAMGRRGRGLEPAVAALETLVLAAGPSTPGASGMRSL